MARKPSTTSPLHLAVKEGRDSRILCGIEKRTTYRDLDAGTNTRMIEAQFFGPKHPEYGTATVCAACLKVAA